MAKEFENLNSGDVMNVNFKFVSCIPKPRKQAQHSLS